MSNYTIDKIDGFGRFINLTTCKSTKEVIAFISDRDDKDDLIIREYTTADDFIKENT